MTKKYFIHTFGCHDSEADSERISGDYESKGYTSVSSWKKADEIILNTCSVTQASEDNVLNYVGEIDAYFSDKSRIKPKIIFTGCMTHYGAEEIMKKIPCVDEVLPISEVGFNNQAIRRDKKHAWVQLSAGCNCFCSYCIIPYSRGREKSRSIEDIVSEVKKLASAGYTEITLLAMNTNSYGLEKEGKSQREMLFNLDKRMTVEDIPSNQSQYRKNKGKLPLIELIQQVSTIKNIQKIDLLTSNVWDFSNDLIDEITSNKKINTHLHIPIQSGSNRILKLMNRGYSREDCLHLIQKIKDKQPNFTFSTDFIVGFPTETESEFMESVSISEKISWTNANIYYYSPRVSSLAYRFYPDDIPLAEKKRRWEILNNIINRHEN